MTRPLPGLLPAGWEKEQKAGIVARVQSFDEAHDKNLRLPIIAPEAYMVSGDSFRGRGRNELLRASVKKLGRRGAPPSRNLSCARFDARGQSIVAKRRESLYAGAHEWVAF